MVLIRIIIHISKTLRGLFFCDYFACMLAYGEIIGIFVIEFY